MHSSPQSLPTQWLRSFFSCKPLLRSTDFGNRLLLPAFVFQTMGLDITSSFSGFSPADSQIPSCQPHLRLRFLLEFTKSRLSTRDLMNLTNLCYYPISKHCRHLHVLQPTVSHYPSLKAECPLSILFNTEYASEETASNSPFSVLCIFSLPLSRGIQSVIFSLVPSPSFRNHAT